MSESIYPVATAETSRHRHELAPEIDEAFRAFSPRWTSENRPTMDGSKPANGQDPGPVRF